MKWKPGKNKKIAVPIANQDIIGHHYQQRLANSEKLLKVSTKDSGIKKVGRRSRKISWIVLIIVIVLIASGVFGFIKLKSKKLNTLPLPISKTTAQTLGFDIYYPNQALLPSGYTLNMSSFNYNDQVLIYTVSYGNNQKLVFSDQAKPTNSEIQGFYHKNMPLNTSYPTNIGLATIGAIKNQSVVSLPTKTNAWLLITAPGNIDQNQLNKILKSIEIAM